MMSKTKIEVQIFTNFKVKLISQMALFPIYRLQTTLSCPRNSDIKKIYNKREYAKNVNGYS